jgi:hypothetical protein
MHSEANRPASSAYELITAEHSEQTWRNVDRGRVIDAFKKHGAVLLRGFAAELDDFVTFGNQFCDGYVPNPLSQREYVSEEHCIQTVDGGDAYFPLHAERSQTPFRADIAFFHCQIAPRSGGQTFFCDGSLLTSILPDSVKEQLMPRLLWYRGVANLDVVMGFLGISDPEELEATLRERGLDQIYFFKEGKLLQSFMTPVFEKPRFTNELVFANFLLFARFAVGTRRYPCFEDGSEIPTSLCTQIAELAESITTQVNWETRDLLMLDNTRVMHGRMAIENINERRILTRFGYANFS